MLREGDFQTEEALLCPLFLVFMSSQFYMSLNVVLYLKTQTNM